MMEHPQTHPRRKKTDYTNASGRGDAIPDKSTGNAPRGRNRPKQTNQKIHVELRDPRYHEPIPNVRTTRKRREESGRH